MTVVEWFAPARPTLEWLGQTEGTLALIAAQGMTAVASVIGPPGANGSAGARYVHTQASAATLWTVPHNLGFRPVVSIYSAGGQEIAGGEVLHLSALTLTITFDVAFAGSTALV